VSRWVGDATRVVALAKVVTQTRLDTEAAALTGVRMPDHVDVLADMASCALWDIAACRHGEWRLGHYLRQTITPQAFSLQLVLACRHGKLWLNVKCGQRKGMLRLRR